MAKWLVLTFLKFSFSANFFGRKSVVLVNVMSGFCSKSFDLEIELKLENQFFAYSQLIVCNWIVGNLELHLV